MSTPASKPAAIPMTATKKPVTARKPSISTVKSPSIRKETDKTTPYVLLRKPTTTSGPATRQIVNFIEVGDTQNPSHVKPMRVAVVEGYTFGTNFPSTVTSLKGARVFAYSTVAAHGLSSAKVQPWSKGNDVALQALMFLGLITSYELEFHRAEAKKLGAAETAAKKAKELAEQQKKDSAALTALTKAIIKSQGITAARDALRKASSALL